MQIVTMKAKVKISKTLTASQFYNTLAHRKAKKSSVDFEVGMKQTYINYKTLSSERTSCW